MCLWLYVCMCVWGEAMSCRLAYGRCKMTQTAQYIATPIALVCSLPPCHSSHSKSFLLTCSDSLPLSSSLSLPVCRVEYLQKPLTLTAAAMVTATPA